MLLAFDDTDGPDGGCTTHVVFHVLLALPEYALRGMPRLVRLNPNVPWKTRGNAAVVLDLGLPEGPQAPVGELRGREILAFPEAPQAPVTEEVLDRIWKVVQGQARADAVPAVLAFDAPPLPSAYHVAVQTFVPPEATAATLAAMDARWRAAGDGRALTGCLGALAWPGPAASYEFIAYRHPSRWGTPRNIDPAPFRSLDATGATFHSWDPEADRAACIPNTPCPVLAGLRGTDPEALEWAAVHALQTAAAEPVDGWLLFATNQASGDHVVPVEAFAEAPGLATIEMAATVTGTPETRAGGHVFVPMQDPAGTPFEAAAFEPTKSFRDVVRGLRPGDGVTVVGALADGVVRLERLEVRTLAPVRTKTGNPTCVCGDRMKSKGANKGYRCPSCGATADADAGEWTEEARTVAAGWHEVPVMARRHLHRPLSWGRV